MSLPAVEVTPAKESPLPEKKLDITPPLPKSESDKEPVAASSAETVDAAIIPSEGMISVPSTENLIPAEKPDVKPPVPSRISRKIEDIKPIRKHTKSGWL